MTASRRSSIRRSTSGDLRRIKEWLEDEKGRGVEGNFLCNWSLIENGHRSRDLLVYVDGPSAQPVAFLLGKTPDIDILQVKQQFQRTGVARKLVARCIETAKARNEYLLDILCRPETSVPFWKSMGFTVFQDERWDTYAYRVLDLPLSLPVRGADLDVVFRLYPQKREWAPETPAFHVYETVGRRVDDVIHLPRRALFHDRLGSGQNGLMVEIVADGSSIQLDKAKHLGGRGLERCRHGWYIDWIDVG